MHCRYGYGGRCRTNVALSTMFHEYHALLYFPAFRTTECMMLVAVGRPSVVLGNIRQDHFIAACNTAHFTLSDYNRLSRHPRRCCHSATGLGSTGDRKFAQLPL